MALLYNDAPTVSFSLDEFSLAASEMWAAEEYDEFIRFVVTGEFLDDDGNRRQAFIDPIRNRTDADHPLTVSRDYDSAIGISSDILVDGPISVFAVPHPTFALKTSIHMKHTILYEGEPHEVEFHHIPNFEFGTFGARHHLNIFFPKLWSPERSSDSPPHSLTVAQRAFWYEHGLRPAIQHLLGSVAAEWPATYQTEEIRARRTGGGFAWGTKIIQRDVINQLMERIRLQFLMSEDENAHWAVDAFVMHTIRGVKHGSFHQADPHSAVHYLAELFEDAQLVEDAPEQGEWFIDVGIQISSDLEQCVQWRTATHRLVVQQALRISDLNAERVTQINSSKYYRDLASHLTAVSGFRIVPGSRAAGAFEAAYIQAYTTDKSVVYNVDGTHHAKFLTTREALGPDHPTKTVEGIHDIYEKARDVNASSARLEVRVPYRFATQVLLEFDPAVLRDCLCLFSQEEWWNFRIIRLMGMSQTLSLQQSGPTQNRFMPESLTLTAACVWLVNGLHARPDDGPASRNLMDSALPITEAEDANLEVLAYNTSVRRQETLEAGDDDEFLRGRVPYNPYGCVFLRRIMLPQVPRMRHGGPNLSPPAFKFWFSGMTPLQLEAKYKKTGVIDRRVVAAFRSTTAKVKMPVYANPTGEPEPNLFNLAARGHSQPHLIDDDLSDIEDRETPPPMAGAQDLDTHLSNIWRQFVCDLTSKSPNQRGLTNPSYLKLSTTQRRSGSEAPYKHLRLSELFVAVYYKKASKEVWKTSFNWLFPPLGRTISSAVQNYAQSPYYGMWGAFLERNQNNPRLIEDTRKEFFSKIMQWSWMPWALVDRMWQTAAHREPSRLFTRWPPAPGHPAAPHILLHLKGVPEFPVQRGNAFEGEVIEID